MDDDRPRIKNRRTEALSDTKIHSREQGEREREREREREWNTQEWSGIIETSETYNLNLTSRKCLNRFLR